MATYSKTGEDEEKQLLEQLKEMTDQKKAVFERVKDKDAKLVKIRQNERAATARLQQIRDARVATEQREKYETRTVNDKYVTMKQELEGLKMENAGLKSCAAESRCGRERLQTEVTSLKAMLSVCEQEHGHSRSGNVPEEAPEMTRGRDVIHSSSETMLKCPVGSDTHYSKTHHGETEKLQRQVGSLEDEISALRKISAETQRRQLVECQPIFRWKKRTKQSQELINGSQANKPDHGDLLRGLYWTISTRINAQTVARNMFQCNALTLKELQSIQSKRSKPTKATQQLLNIVINESSGVYAYFLNSLKETKQLVAYKLIIEGSYRGFDDHFAHTRIIQQHYVFLVDSLDAKHSGLVGELYQSGVLSVEETESLTSEVISFTRNEKLLSVLSRKAKDQFDKFLDALDKTDQRHIRNHITGRQDGRHEDVHPDTLQDTGMNQLMEQQTQHANDVVACKPRVATRLTIEHIGDRPLTVHMITRLSVRDSAVVAGVTWLDDRVYVVSEKSNIIAVFTSEKPFRSLQVIVVDGLECPTDISASVSSGCLYVPDLGSGDPVNCVVWRIDVADGEVVQWLSGVRVWTLSVGSGEQLVLLVAVDLQRTGEERSLSYHGEVHIYSPDAVRQTIIKLPHEVVSPWHVVMTSTETIIICYGREWHDRNGVCEVDMTAGHILKALISPPGNGVDQLNVPCHLSLVNDDRIIMADSCNNRLLLLNRQLEIQHVVVSWNDPQSSSDGVGGPGRLHYDRLTGELLVGLDSGHIDVYKIA